MHLSKQQEKVLRKFADSLPVITVDSTEKHIMTGAEALTAGVNFKEGVKVEAAANYTVTRHIEVPVNHFRRLKDAWKQGGEAAVQRYLDKIGKAVEAHKQSTINDTTTQSAAA